MSNTKITVEVVDDNPFNVGWLLYLLGQPQPDVLEEPEAGADPSRAVMDAASRVDGWKMGADTPTVGLIRRVFADEQPAYRVAVRAGAPEEAKPKPEEVKPPVPEGATAFHGIPKQPRSVTE